MTNNNMTNNSFDDLFVTEREHKQRSTFHPWNKEEWLEHKKQERESTFELLEEATKAAAASPAAFRQYLDVQAAFDRYSSGNCLLISARNPKAVKLADYDTWKDQDVYVNRGESGILILEPGNEYTRADGTTGISMNVKRVFDISQTSAADTVIEKQNYDMRKVLNALMEESPVDLKVGDELPDKINVSYNKDENAIYLRRGMDGETIFRTLAYEITVIKMAQRGESDVFAAQAATYMMCKRFNMPDPGYSFGDTELFFSGKDTKQIRAELEKMRSYANELSQPMKKALELSAKQRSGEAR